MDDNEARQILDNMLPTGVLKIITNEHACGAGAHASIIGFKQPVCDRFEFPVTSPKHFVVHTVTSLRTSPIKTGLLEAHSDEGDICIGHPVDLLRRLTKASLQV